MNANKVILHGEAMLFHSELPEGAVEIKPSSDGYHIIADSETTGNHHVVDAVEGVKFFQFGNRLFVKNSAETAVRCLHPNRHDAVTLEPNVWEIDRQQEYDHFEQNLRSVRD